MEKELKIAELAKIWGVSVPTTWNRIRKDNLTTFIKKNENNKDVNYVRISDEKIKEYVINVNNIDKNVHYEELLNVDNVNNDVIDAEYVRQDAQKGQIIITDLFNGLKEVYNDCNERLEKVNNELITYKSKALLLEDKASREGLYINEINTLKTDINNVKKDNNKLLLWLITVIILSILCIAALGILLTVYINKPPKIIETEKVVTVEKPVYVKGRK